MVTRRHRAPPHAEAMVGSPPSTVLPRLPDLDTFGKSDTCLQVMFWHEAVSGRLHIQTLSSMPSAGPTTVGPLDGLLIKGDFTHGQRHRTLKMRVGTFLLLTLTLHVFCQS